jgi:phosphopantetheinyl transferase (holo-ACP synthase)
MIKLAIETKKIEEIEDLEPHEIKGIFTTSELSHSSNITLAGKLAAKAAFLRNAGFSDFAEHYKKVVVDKTFSGRPFLKIFDASIMGKISDFKTSVSISHTKDTAVAICILYNESFPNSSFSQPPGSFSPGRKRTG